MVMRNPGTHQVEINTATSATRPKSELHGPGGAKRRIAFSGALVGAAKSQVRDQDHDPNKWAAKKGHADHEHKSGGLKKMRKKKSDEQADARSHHRCNGHSALAQFSECRGSVAPARQ